MTKLHCPTCGAHIDEHEAGGCLDLWAGEVVMGFGYNEESSGLSKRWFGRPDRYSDRIGPAWMLVETWKYNWNIYRDVGACGDVYETSGDKNYRVVLAYPGMDMTPTVAKTAPLAITRAAIKAVSG